MSFCQSTLPIHAALNTFNTTNTATPLNTLPTNSLNLTPEVLDQLLDSLVEKGWFEWPNAVTDALCKSLLTEVVSYDVEDKLQRAGIGRGIGKQINRQIRCDRTRWLDGSTASQRAYQQQMSELKQALNRELFMGLFEYECHFALYKKGGFYKKHLDSFRGRANRMLTTVLYLNPDWQADWGGELVVYSEDSSQILAKITPEMGKMVIFMSEQIPHEVLPTQHPRVSVAGWFRLNNSTAAVADPAL